MAREQRRTASVPIHLREMWDAGEVAAMMGTTRETVLALRREGHLPEPMKFAARLVRWRADEIREWIRAGCPERDAWQYRPILCRKVEDRIKQRVGELRAIEDEIKVAEARLSQLEAMPDAAAPR